MRTLAIETATEACSVALFDGDDLVAEDHKVLGRGHAERLVPMIAALPDKGRCDRILVSLGPGSFTGVRIGVATARALGFAWDAEVLGYPTLALVAAIAQSELEEPVTVCMNGGHGEWFVADFAPGSKPLEPTISLSPQKALTRGARSYIAGNRAEEFGELLGRDPACLKTLLPRARFAHALPSDILRTSLTPIYGRGPDAVPQAESLAQ
ncbi:tRNA (adenosine(37)-N6)-threonylcarbamoyltransferase complex dimerization subunit type 1 TsaB [Erythrobacter rubeus]|uniref:tRNA (Adenosine(37)-N6)-threonylcarbamoyltransferase complex dimerization subunit type 1 TsaB n=1 Tax=Erythrobacter rubeus TaxID=2760803 RepID=A0ABR8KSE7_9SPHN|nr:tRNA (adenosine(37)-N6)-threonylcarbamoyltransferase complex dimerization subunit type 1 TsaB [Erythrobacter rubeus]MBD2841369.1 tRNA (adenosine(37)-N6)-threonylcarbamoyltransferase complex dimerization subunit type 1 TsaB [Erythrobacter rubeus]